MENKIRETYKNKFGKIRSKRDMQSGGYAALYELAQIMKIFIKEDSKFYAMRHNYLKHFTKVFDVPMEILEYIAREMESWDLAFAMNDILIRNERESDSNGTKVSKSDLQEFYKILKERLFNATDYIVIREAIGISLGELISILNNKNDDSCYNIVPFYSETLDIFDIDKMKERACEIIYNRGLYTEEDFFKSIEHSSFGLLSLEFINKHYAKLAKEYVPYWNKKYQYVKNWDF